ncbi:MAG: hypothetical protein H0X00_19995, partial [Sporichthya sp.]|nr:hypothetical protein [Sporichthya sp.]
SDLGVDGAGALAAAGLTPADLALGSSAVPGAPGENTTLIPQADPAQYVLTNGSSSGASLEGPYLTLVALACVALAAATVIRLIGVRFLWSS